MKKQTYDLEERLLEYSVGSKADSLFKARKSTCSVLQNRPIGHSGLDPESIVIAKHQQNTVWKIRIQATSVNKQPAVYILASKRNGTLYIGVTSDLVKRIWKHKNKMVEGFTKRYNVHRLVWYELHESMESAITQEKRLKNWKRKWKLELIESINPKWLDLYHNIV